MSKTQRQPNQTQHLNSLFSLQQGQCNQIQMNSSIGQAGSGRNQTHHPSTLGTSRFNQNLNKLVSMALSGELARALQGNLTSQPNIALGNNTNDDDLISKLQGAEALQQLLQQPRLQSSPETQPGEIVNTKSKSPEGQQSSSLSSEKQDSSQGTAREVSTSASSAKPSKRSRRSNQKREDKDDQIVVVPCRARGMCMEHTFQVSLLPVFLISLNYHSACDSPDCLFYPLPDRIL